MTHHLQREMIHRVAVHGLRIHSGYFTAYGYSTITTHENRPTRRSSTPWSGGSLHDTGRRARRGRAVGRLPRAIRPALRVAVHTLGRWKTRDLLTIERAYGQWYACASIG